MKIAIGGIAHETNTFSTLPTSLEDFTILRGTEVLSGGLSDTFWNGIRHDGHEIYPLLRAYATPSGKVSRYAFEMLLSELVEGIAAAMPLDGVLLYLHGAMEVEGIGDGETAILEAVRSVVGEQPLVAATLDLHANLAPAVAALADIVTAYRTAPHRDAEETRIRGAELLVYCLEEGIRPAISLVKLPLLIAGEAAVTEVSPARELFADLPARVRDGGLLDASILIGCAWTDSPFTTVSTLACGVDPGKTRESAVDLAASVWRQRASFAVDSVCAAPEEVANLALSYSERPVLVSDSGDNPTAGAAGDSPYFLKVLLKSFGAAVPPAESAKVLVAGIADANAASACIARGIGGTVSLNLGGKLDSVTCGPLSIEVAVLGVFPDDTSFGHTALVRAGGIDLVIHTLRQPFTALDDFSRLGLRPDAYEIVVVKLGYLFPGLRDYAPRHIMAMTPGFGDQRLDRLPYTRLKRPIFPLDQEAHFDIEQR